MNGMLWGSNAVQNCFMATNVLAASEEYPHFALFAPLAGATFVYFADAISGGDRGLLLPIDAGSGSAVDGALAGSLVAEAGSGADLARSLGYGGDAPAGSDGSLGLPLAGESGSGLEIASWSSTVAYADAGAGLDGSIVSVLLGDAAAGSESWAATSVTGFTLIGSTKAGGNGTSASLPLGWTVAVGDLIVVALAFSAGVTPTVTDTAGNTYTLAASVAGSWPGRIYYSIATTGGAGVTVNVSFGSTFYGVSVAEYSAPGTISLDTTGTGTDTGTAAAPSSALSLAGSGEMVALLVNVGAGSLDYTPDVGYTVEQSYNIAGVKDFAYADSLSQSGSITPTLTLSSSTSWTAVAAAFKFSSPATFVYAGDSGGGSEGVLPGSIDVGSGSAGDGGRPLWYAAELTAGADSSLRAMAAGDSSAESEASLATLTTVEYGRDLATALSASLGLIFGGESGNATDVASWASSLVGGDSSALASAGLRIAILGDPGAVRESAPIQVVVSIGSVVGTDGALASEGWSIVVLSDIPRAYWFAPEAARLVPIDRMDPDAFEVDPYAARLVVLAAMDPDSFEVDPYAARVITP